MKAAKEPWTRDEVIATRKQEIHSPTDANRCVNAWRKTNEKYLEEIIAEGEPLNDVCDLPIISQRERAHRMVRQRFGRIKAPQKRRVFLRKMVSQNFASWNQLERWFRDIDALRRVA